MLFLVFSSVFLLATSVKAQSAACQDGLQVCTSTYMRDVFEHAQAKAIDLICEDLNIFIKCIFDLECGMEEAQKNMVIEKVREEIAAQGFECEVNLEGVSTRAPRPTDDPADRVKPDTCLGATQYCTENYISEAFEMAKKRGEDLSWFCPLVNKLVDCLIDSPCKLQEIQDTIRDKIEIELQQKGINCDINLSNRMSENEKVVKEGDENSAAKQRTSFTIFMLAATGAYLTLFF